MRKDKTRLLDFMVSDWLTTAADSQASHHASFRSDAASRQEVQRWVVKDVIADRLLQMSLYLVYKSI